jgi:RND family efflux transporter MFP subunit
MVKLIRGARQVAVAVVFIALVTLLMLWLSGRFSPKIALSARAGEVASPLPPGASVVDVRTVRLPVTEPAVGTIRAEHETTIASHILARVVEINLKAGQPVKQGDVLLRLDDTDLQARLQQARATAASATASRDQAATDEHRLAALVPEKAASQNEYDKAATALKTAEADVNRANQAIAESQAILAYATIQAPMDGIVVDKKVDVGDTVSPGLPLLTIYDPHRMQLIANVRESLARRLQVGQDIGVRLDVLQKTCTGQISEIVPDAQSSSRTFQVKVTGPCPPGLYTGMFGRIFVPLDQREVLLIPSTAVRHVGQLELVDVLEEGMSRRRSVRTGQVIGEDCEVLSGLAVGEKIIVPAGAATSEPAEGVQQ